MALALGQAHLRDVEAAGGNSQLFEARKNESMARGFELSNLKRLSGGSVLEVVGAFGEEGVRKDPEDGD